MKTIRELVYWEYAKLISERAIGDRKGYGFVTYTFQRLMRGQIEPSSILAENQQLFAQGEVCAYCGATGRLHWEHIIPVSKGGPDTIDNMVRACAPCNLAKGARDPYQWYAAKGEIDAVPRVVLGKFLKLVFEAYGHRGVLDSETFMLERGIRRVTLGEVFLSGPSGPDALGSFGDGCCASALVPQ